MFKLSGALSSGTGSTADAGSNTDTGGSVDGGSVGGGNVGSGSVGGLFGRRMSSKFLGMKLQNSKMSGRNLASLGGQVKAIISGIAKIPGTSTLEFNATLQDPASIGG